MDYVYVSILDDDWTVHADIGGATASCRWMKLLSLFYHYRHLLIERYGLRLPTSLNDLLG